METERSNTLALVMRLRGLIYLWWCEDGGSNASAVVWVLGDVIH